MEGNNHSHKSCNASKISIYLGLRLIGDNIYLNKPVSLNDSQDGTISFINRKNIAENINVKALYIVLEDKIIDENSIASYIRVKNPRLVFAKIVQKFFVTYNQNKISTSAIISKSAKLGNNVNIGNFCTIEDGVIIGDNTIINNNVVISKNCIIGKNCYIKSGTVVGEDGFGFDFEEDGTPVRVPHTGRVIIGDDVEIGAKCTIAKGTLVDTIIQNYVKIDDQVHIGHNCMIGEKTIITACAELSGGVIVGKKCWIGPNISIIQKTNIGDGATVGIGSVVTKDVLQKKKIMGLEALELRSLIKIKKKIEYK